MEVVDDVEETSEEDPLVQPVDISVSSDSDVVDDVDSDVVDDVEDVEDVDEVVDEELLLEDEEQPAFDILMMTETSMSPSIRLPSMLTSAASSIAVEISTFTLVSLETGSVRVML